VLKQDHQEVLMLWTLIVVLLVLWAVGLATSYTAGGLLHLLLLVALVMFVVQLVSGSRTI
jgi:hypothetical protein